MVMKDLNMPLIGKDGKPRMPGQIGETKVQVVPKQYDWGVYFWKLPTGRMFSDGEGNYLTIQSMKGDLSQIAKLRQAAAHYGQPEGEPVFEPGVQKISDEEYSEQVERMKQGLIPNLNDLGAVQAAKDTIAKYGDEE
jgi:hypothetical protein